ncbi:hypothetical protein [Thermithiobacillus plumbiphilus]|uniref:Uncharacterized protein n=1 Tax=Thermithiobacillus plumbiphilus TaxID=1729899 RepID=A0ABU9DA94_9PROT
MSLFPQFDPDLDSIPAAILAIPAIPEHPNSENSGNSTDPVPVPVPAPVPVTTPEDAAAMRLSAIESSGLALLVKVDDGYMVWASTKARIPDEWADYPRFTMEELRLIPPGNGQAARDWLALKRTFPASTMHPVSEDEASTTPPAPAFVTCATCQHYQAGERGGIGACAMQEDQRTTPPSERYPAGHPIQPALYPHARRICSTWEAP